MLAILVAASFAWAHWNVRGPDFFQLHELFDRVAEEADGHADLIAERAGQLGGSEAPPRSWPRRATCPPTP